MYPKQVISTIGSRNTRTSLKAVQNKTLVTTPQPIKELISSLLKVSNIDESLQVLSDASRTIKDFVEINTNTFFYKGYHISVSLQLHTDVTAEILDFVNEIGIHSAPELVEHIKVKDGSSVIVTYYKGCEDGIPGSYNEAKSGIQEEACRQFIDDMETLASVGYIHPYALREQDKWRVNSQGAIVLDSWNRLEKVHNEEEIEGLINLVRKNLQV